MAYQRAYFPSKLLDLSQGYGSSSGTHKLSYAFDFYGIQDIVAPFDCKITKLYQPSDTKTHANTVWLTSTKKVLSKNGEYGYLTMSITHPSEISNMKLGTVYKQGTKICTTKKMTGTATGNHYHMELAKGIVAGWNTQKSGSYIEYVIKNKIKPEDYLFVKEDSIIKRNSYKGTKYNFRKESDLIYKVKGTDGTLNVRKEPYGTIIKTIKENAEVIKFYTNNSWAYIYNYGSLGWVSEKYLKK